MEELTYWNTSSNHHNVINNNHVADDMMTVIVIAMMIRKCLLYQELPDTAKILRGTDKWKKLVTCVNRPC